MSTRDERSATVVFRSKRLTSIVGVLGTFAWSSHVQAQSIFSQLFDEPDKSTPYGLDVLEDDKNDLAGAPVVFTDAGETVQQAVTAALLKNPQIILAKTQIDSAKADRFGALGEFLPNIEGSASYSEESWRNERAAANQSSDGLSVGVTVSQPVFQGLQATNRYKASKSRLEQSVASSDETFQSVALEAARAHASVVLSREIVEHRQMNVELVERQFEIADARMKAGAQSRTGVEQARMRQMQAQVSLEEARAIMASNEALYARIIGHRAPPALALDGRDDTFGLNSLAQAINELDHTNPSIIAAKKGVSAAKYDKNAARGAFSPTVSIDGSYFTREEQGSATTLNNGDDEYEVVARMRVPIFAKGQNIASLRRANSGVLSQQAQLDEIRLFVTETTTRTWQEILRAKARVNAAKLAIEAATISVEGLQMEYRAGRRSVIDVLDGQRDLVNAEISLSQAEFDLRNARYELAATTGRLVAEMAKEPVDEVSP